MVGLLEEMKQGKIDGIQVSVCGFKTISLYLANGDCWIKFQHTAKIDYKGENDYVYHASTGFREVGARDTKKHNQITQDCYFRSSLAQSL